MSSRKLNGDGSYEDDDGEYMPPNKKRKGNAVTDGDDPSYSEDDDDMYDEQDMDNVYDIDNAPVIEHRHEEEPPPVPTTVTPSSLRKNKKRSKAEEAAAPAAATATAKEEQPDKANKNRYHCNYCRKDITDCVRIKCSVCTDFDLCVECFSVGVEISPHKNSHEYQVMDNMHFPLLDESWGADEEILLLEAIEMYGLGNWSDVSDHVGTKPWIDCKMHYFDTYINAQTAPLPDVSKVITTHAMVQMLNKKSRDAKLGTGIPVKPVPKVAMKAPPPPLPTPSNNEIHLALVDQLGYMKNRNEFETEYENDAELIVRDVTFDEDDEPQERELKLKALELYNQKLDERVRIRKFILDNGLLDYKKIQQQDRRRSKEDRELYNNMRVFLQPPIYDELLQGLVYERQLRRRIEQLQKWRGNGIKTLAEGELFEVESQRRENSIRRQKDSAGYYTFDKSGSGRAVSSRRDRYLARERDENALARLDKLKSKPRKLGQPLDLEGEPGVELLSVKEKQLCSTVRILPKQYMLIKDTLLAEYARLGHLNKTIARGLVKIDVNKTARLFEFFEQSGWINKSNNAPPPSALELPSSSSSLPQTTTTTNTTQNTIITPPVSFPTSLPMNLPNQTGIPNTVMNLPNAATLPNLVVVTQPQVQLFQPHPLVSRS